MNNHHLISAIYYLLYRIHLSLAENVDLLTDKEKSLIEDLKQYEQ